MLKVSKEEKNGVLAVRFSGSIEETADFDQLIGAVPEEIHVYSRDVSRINSMGVKAWIKYFQSLKQTGKILRFFECSFAVLQQANQISNFVCGGAIESLYAPFTCEDCNKEFAALFTVEHLLKIGLEVPDQKCPHCSGKAIFDDIPKEYFVFLTRTQAPLKQQGLLKKK